VKRPSDQFNNSKWQLRTLGSNVLAAALIVAIGAMLIAGGLYLFWGEPTVKHGQIVRFGGYSGETGSYSLVVVRLDGGGEAQVSSELWRVIGCIVGDRVELLRRPHRWTISPRGCRH
jgi:hypothetical protein